jgi:hypothetical protein
MKKKQTSSNTKKERQQQHKTALVVLTGAVLIIGISTIYPTGSSGLLSAAYAAAQTSTTVERIPVDDILFVPCAAGGAGEEVHVTGRAHTVIHTTLDNAGGFHSNVRANLQGVSGTGLTTGDKYQATGAIGMEVNGKVGQEETRVINIHIIGQGNGNNFLAHGLFHMTVNADGTVTSFVDNVRVECK